MKKILLVLFTVVFASSVYGAEYKDFAKDLQPAYKEWKKSLGVTSANKKEESIKVGKAFLTKWKEFKAKYYKNVPVEFKGIESYQSDLNRIEEVAGKAVAEMERGQVIHSHETLEEVRYILWNLRARAGIETLNDKLNDYHEIMEIVLESTELVDNEKQLQMLAAKQGVWMKIKWNEIISFIKKNGYGSEILKAAENEKKAVEEYLKYARAGNIDKADMTSKPIKINFKKVFFSEEVY